jgi:hypothetical protein
MSQFASAVVALESPCVPVSHNVSPRYGGSPDLYNGRLPCGTLVGIPTAEQWSQAIRSWEAVGDLSRRSEIYMLATAGTMSATIVAVMVTGAFVVSAWGSLDVLVRPSLACRVAHVSKGRWLLALGCSSVAILFSTLSLLIVRATLVIGVVGAIACLVGLIGGTWYLAMVRPWVAAQVSFARRRPEQG